MKKLTESQKMRKMLYLMEGTWAHPGKVEDMHKLITILDNGLTAGEYMELYGLIGDDDFFDRVGELSEDDPMSSIVQVAIDQVENWIDDVYEWNEPWDKEAIKMWKMWLKTRHQ